MTGEIKRNIIPPEIKLGLIRSIVLHAETTAPRGVGADNMFFGIYLAIRAVLGYEAIRDE